MPLNASMLLLLLFLGFSFARPGEGIMAAVADGGLSGLLVRRLLPAIVLLPVMLVWVSWQGARLGWYEPQFAMTLFVTLALGALGYVILYGGSVLSRIEDERLAAEKERLISEGRLRRAVNQAPVPMVIHDDDDIVHMSEGWTRQSGYSLDDTPTVTAWAAKAQAVAQPAIKRHLEQLALATDTIHGGESTVVTKSGDRRTWEFSTTPLEELDPKRRTYLTMAIDLTERKKAEEDFQAGRIRTLEQRIQERTREVTQANDALQRQSRTTERAGGVARTGQRRYLRSRSPRKNHVLEYGRRRHVRLEPRAGRRKHSIAVAANGIQQPRGDIDKQLLRDGHWEAELMLKMKRSRVFIESRCTLTRSAQGTRQGVLVFGPGTSRPTKRPSSRYTRGAELAAPWRRPPNEGILVSVDDRGIVQYWESWAPGGCFGLGSP